MKKSLWVYWGVIDSGGGQFLLLRVFCLSADPMLSSGLSALSFSFLFLFLFLYFLFTFVWVYFVCGTLFHLVPCFGRAAVGLFTSVAELAFGKAGGLPSVRFHHRDMCGEGRLQFPVCFRCWVVCRLPYSIWHFMGMVCLPSVDFSFFSFFLEFTGWVRFASLLPHGGTVGGISAVLFRGCFVFLLYFRVVVFFFLS